MTNHIENKHSDVIYLTHLPSEQAQFVLESYKKEHGDSVPVHTDAEAKEALASGCSVALVGPVRCSILRAVGDFIFKRRKTPNEHLEEWLEKHQSTMTPSSLEDFGKIIQDSKRWYR